jgi:hypothetical protein
MSAKPIDHAHSDFGLSHVSSGREISLDVVFVHGLGGPRRLTWTNTNEESGRPGLSESVPNARILDLWIQFRILEGAK